MHLPSNGLLCIHNILYLGFITQNDISGIKPFSINLFNTVITKILDCYNDLLNYMNLILHGETFSKL